MLIQFTNESTRVAYGATSDHSRLDMRDGASRNSAIQLNGPASSSVDVIDIPLGRGQTTQIDQADFGLVSSYSWHWRPSVTSVGRGYAVSSRRHNGRDQTIFLHRLLLNVEKGLDVDHINRNSLDNRRCNLRIATRSQNLANSTFPTRPNANGYRGVVCKKDGRRKPFMAGICVRGRTYRGIHRETAIEAARDYDALAVLHFGEFATLNFPGGVSS